MDDEIGNIIEMKHNDKLSYTFTGRAKTVIDEIQQRTGKSGAEVLKVALALYKEMLDRAEEDSLP